MLDQSQFAPPRTAESEPKAETPRPNRQQIEAAAIEAATQLGATHAEVLSCLAAKLSDAQAWTPAQGSPDAPIWLLIVRAPVGVPRPYGGVHRAPRLEVAIDATNCKVLGFRTAS